MGELERFGEHDLALLDPVGAMQEVGGIQFEEPAAEPIGGAVRRQCHHLHTEHDHRRRVVHDDGHVEVAPGLHGPESRLDLRVGGALGGESAEEAFDLFARDHIGPG